MIGSNRYRIETNKTSKISWATKLPKYMSKFPEGWTQEPKDNLKSWNKDNANSLSKDMTILRMDGTMIHSLIFKDYINALKLIPQKAIICNGHWLLTQFPLRSMLSRNKITLSKTSANLYRDIEMTFILGSRFLLHLEFIITNSYVQPVRSWSLN